MTAPALPPAAPPSASAPAAPAARRPWRVLAALALLAAALLAGLWVWAGREGSLASALRLAAGHLPAGQQLQASDVTGTLRHGGRIGELRWRGPDLAVQVRGARLAWRLAPLLQGRLVLTELRAGQITLSPEGEPDPAPGGPPQSLALPLRVSLPLAADEIVWAAQGSAPIAGTALRGRYDWDGRTHHLTLDNIALAQGRYQVQATLDGAAPMALQAALQGTVQTPVPGSATPLDATAQARIEGTLAGQDARLGLTARLQGEAGDPLRAQVQAQVRPWAAQPLAQARAELQALDLAALWPQAPATRLAGTASLQPQEHVAQSGWELQADLTNEDPGPWNTHRLPLTALQARATYGGTQLTVPEARLHVGAGVLRLSDARYDHAKQALQGTLTLQDLSPARLDGRLDAAPVSGQARVAGSLDGGLRVQAELTGAPAKTSHGLHLEHLRLDALWRDGQAQIHSLSLAALQAKLQATNLTIRPAERAGSGQLCAAVPGATLQLDGALAARSGKGRIDLAVRDAQALQRWLAALPLPQALPPALVQAPLAGNAELQARWEGGWQGPLAQLQAAGTASPPPAFALQADLRVPRLAYAPPDGPPLALRDVQARVDGTLAQASLALDGSASHGAKNEQLTASAHLRASATLRGPGHWQAQVSELTLQARAAHRPGPWQVQSQAPLALELRTRPHLQLQTGAMQARIDGPLPGSAMLHSQPLTLAPPASGLPSHLQGRLEGVPLAWADALDGAQPPLLQRLGMAGDVLLDAAWDVTLADPLRAHASVRRRSGDLRLDIDGQATPVGLRQAEVTLSAEGGQLRLGALWQSERAGEATAQASLPLRRGADGGPLAPDAPLAGTLRAALPDVGVWSMFAPPGWRVRGSLAANVQLAGRLDAPQLSGQISADDLAVRSVLDGVDLKDGRLRAQLQGEHLRITELTLAGGASSGARILGPSGNLTRAPKEGGRLTAHGDIAWQGQAVRLDMAARAEALQVLVRADRQLSLSGDLRAQLQDGQWALTGQLRTDRASLLLPDDSTPALGDDVVVHGGPGHDPKTAAQPLPEAQVQPARPPRIDVQLDLGDDFAVQGHGLTTRLKGRLQITSSGADGPMPRVLGEIRTEQGRYRAWGQMLDVETGLLRFSSAMDNPQLDILALRPHISERVGVQVSGTAHAPRVRLYSEPDMPDAEILSWLVLGRSAAAGGADAALMQQAALALLSGGRDPGSGIAQRLGLDEIGLRGPDADNAASGAALTLGKRLSRDLYVTYEHSLAGAVGTLYIFLDLSRRLTLRGQTGAQSALDLIYTVRYD